MIDRTAIISENAKIAGDVDVGAYSIIGDNVSIGQGTKIGSHVVIEGPTDIGRNNRIFHHCSLGTEPQDITYKKEDTKLIIGDSNTIREFCYFNRGTFHGNRKTVIGNHNYLMGYVHIAHDCILEDNIIMANAVQLAGHVHICRNSFIGGLAGIHQFCRIGAYTMVGGASAVTEDVLPYSIVYGNRAKTANVNIIGLERNNFSKERISVIKKAFLLLYKSSYNTTDAAKRLKELYPGNNDIDYLVDFIEKSKRGIAGHA